MTSIARHMLTVSLFVAALGGGCASPSDTVARHESVAMATGSGGDDAAARGSGPRPDIPWWIYERARDYIVNDSIAARVCGAPAPVPIRVSAEVWCSFLGIEMIPDVGHFLYPTDRADSQHYYDSISSRLTQPCEGYRDSLVMMRLSTGFDPGRTLIFTPIDSSIAPGRYLVQAWLYDGYRAYCDDDRENDTEWMAELYQDEPFPTGCDRFIIYELVFDRTGTLVWAEGWDNQCEL